MERLLLLIFLIVFTLVSQAAGGSWNYNRSSSEGPSNWANMYPNCNGSHQSPINIVTANVTYESSLGHLMFHNFSTVPPGSAFTVTNNGHTLKITPKDDKTFCVSGGGLPTKYCLAQMHLHWGADSSRGSEHTIDGRFKAAEMHMVFHSMNYHNISMAIDKQDGLAVVGVFLMIGSAQSAVDAYLNRAESVLNASSTGELNQTHNLDNLLPSNRHFYRYRGSLTTPSCDQSVIWSVMKDALQVPEQQIAKLRALKQEDGVHTIVDNHRPVQPLNSRVVKTNVDPNASTTQGPVGTTTSSAINVVSGFFVVAIAMVMSAFV